METMTWISNKYLLDPEYKKLFEHILSSSIPMPLVISGCRVGTDLCWQSRTRQDSSDMRAKSL